ncbi:hypothetical protein M8818_007004 [Zalaria obscura]|uniref:Uncharacterized protein n=1 Tax=Zalaria obscura TaxID=2024903 RepID=A0ACC3S498_9PEZI
MQSSISCKSVTVYKSQGSSIRMHDSDTMDILSPLDPDRCGLLRRSRAANASSWEATSKRLLQAMINGMSQVPSNLSAVVGLQSKTKNDRHWSHEYDGMASATSLATPLAVQTIQTVGDRHSPTPGFAPLAPETASDGNDLHAYAAQPFLSA